LEQLERQDADAAVRLEELLRQTLAGPDVHRRPVEGLGAGVAAEVTGGDEQRALRGVVLEVAATVLDAAAIDRTVPAVDPDRPAQLEASVLAARGDQRSVVAALGDLDLAEVERVEHLHARLLEGAGIERGQVRAERARRRSARLLDGAL